MCLRACHQLADQTEARQRCIQIGKRRVELLASSPSIKLPAIRQPRDQEAAQAQGNDAHFAFFTHAAPPVPPAVEREDDKEDLQQRIRIEPCAIEDDEVEDVGGENHWPADSSARREPDANCRGHKAGDFRPVGDQIMRMRELIARRLVRGGTRPIAAVARAACRRRPRNQLRMSDQVIARSDRALFRASAARRESNRPRRARTPRDTARASAPARRIPLRLSGRTDSYPSSIAQRWSMCTGTSSASHGILHQCEPLDDVAFDGMRDIVHRVGAIANPKSMTEVACACGLGVAPEEVGGMQIVVCPERLKRRQQRHQLSVKGSEQVEGHGTVLASLRFMCKHGSGHEILFQAFGGILRCEDREAGDKRTGLSGRRAEIFGGTAKARQHLSSGTSVFRSSGMVSRKSRLHIASTPAGIPWTS